MHMHMATGRIGGCAGGALESPGTMAGQAVARCRRPDRTAPMFLRCLAAFLPVVLVGAACVARPAHAADRQEFRIGLTVLPAAEVQRLPEVVQRLEALQPGYGDHWAHAWRLAATDPLQAVRALRRVHATMLERPGAAAWKGEMAAAGQALFHRHGAAAIAGL